MEDVVRFSRPDERPGILQVDLQEFPNRPDEFMDVLEGPPPDPLLGEFG